MLCQAPLSHFGEVPEVVIVSGHDWKGSRGSSRCEKSDTQEKEEDLICVAPNLEMWLVFE